MIGVLSGVGGRLSLKRSNFTRTFFNLLRHSASAALSSKAGTVSDFRLRRFRFIPFTVPF
jgi:hypothetical protein